jgi:hypothetical protein
VVSDLYIDETFEGEWGRAAIMVHTMLTGS